MKQKNKDLLALSVVHIGCPLVALVISGIIWIPLYMWVWDWWMQ